MRNARAFSAGLIGAFAMTAGSGVLRLLGVPIDWEMMLGSFVTGSVGPLSWLLGLGIHVSLGGVSALAYAASFEYAFREASAGIGAAIGAVHAVISGIALALVPPLHPLVPDLWPAPGLFLLTLGAFGVLLFLALHVIFGAIVGAVYAMPPVPKRILLPKRLRALSRP